jgi:hypothetical protein
MGLLRRCGREVGTGLLLSHAAIADGVVTNLMMTILADVRRLNNGSVSIWPRLKVQRTLRTDIEQP